ncbi:PH domain-containing protein [Ruminococcaceae bacterium OttesenSCG-928-D13]|nr:PH domain-containing protein [Ruminococcaceae bacterium OttesenSCG-928-D13]
MIDFKNASFMKLKAVDNNSFAQQITPMFVEGEQIICTFQGMRDGVVFTTHRIISINVQGMTGKKKDYSSLPYSKIQAFSVETAGVLDLDSELELWFSGLGKVKLEFTSATNIADICRIISGFVLR